jgi:hypothetical protein
MMVRPYAFRFNEETAADNHFQRKLGLGEKEATERALIEFDGLVALLRENGIEVIVFQDDAYPETPDSVFPNNWVTFHQDGRVAMFPMAAMSRRGEKREEMFDIIADDFGYGIKEIEDFTGFESEGLFLEGTGSMVLDRENGIAYAALSKRTDLFVLETFCERFDFEYVAFTANQNVGTERLPLYHTNVMMALGTGYAVICATCIDDETERKEVISQLKKSGKKIIEITEDQCNRFAGNILELQGESGRRFCVMSSTAFESLRNDQIEAIRKHAEIIHAPLGTIEAFGGGSARCMMAEIFLPKTEFTDDSN